MFYTRHKSINVPYFYATMNLIWGEVFHLGTGKETQILNLAEMVGELLKDQIQITFEKPRKGEIKRNYSDISKAKAFLDLEPQIDLMDGLKGVYEWFMKQGIERIINAHVLSGSE